MIKLIRVASCYLSIKWFARLRWSELTWLNHTSRGITPSYSVLMERISILHSTFEELLDHTSQLSIILDQFIELFLIKITATSSSLLAIKGATSTAKTRHLLLHLPLNLLKARILEKFKLGLELLVLLLQLIEVGRLMGLALEQINHISVNLLDLVVC